MRVLGIDLGSRFVKLAVYNSKEMEFNRVFDTVDFYRTHSRSTDGGLLLDLEKILPKPVDRIVSTGYGRNNIKVFGAEVITELKAHALGAVFQTGWQDFVLLDIGGQDSKVMLIEGGAITDMVMNDKCAASSGRYLENMAALLNISLREMTDYYKDPVKLNSTCAVFAESELIGYISEGEEIERLCSGVNYSLYNRISPMIRRFSSQRIVFAGGVAQNRAMQKFIKMHGGFVEMAVPKLPQMNGAIGCCCYASGI
jgi:predicted CoA-substrate-specific enzyme activase